MSMPSGLSNVWPWSPGSLTFLILLCVVYVLGIRRAQRVAERNGMTTPVTTVRIIAFFGGVLLMALMLLTPIDTIARTQLFLAHMIQIVVLTTFCAPLILFGCSEALLKPFTNTPVARGLGRILTHPVLDSLLFNIVFLLWHSPLFYHLALLNPLLYHVELISIFLVSLFNWWPLVGSVQEWKHYGYPAQIVYTFFDGLPIDIMAFIYVYTGGVIYPYYHVPAQLGISAATDQSAAGALLLLPGVVDFIVMTPLFFKWLGYMEQQMRLSDERRQRLAEAREAALYEEVEEEEIDELPGISGAPEA
jgi:cytochrome c oxidase assembly factor CtaG